MATHNWETFVYASDNHGDQADPDAITKFHEFCADYNPTHRIHGGDLFDLRPLRRGASADERAERIELDVTAGEIFLETYRPDTFLLGNHDIRLWEGIHSNCGLTGTCCLQMLKKLQGEVDDKPLIGGILKKVGVKRVLPYHRQQGIYSLGDLNMIHGYRATMYPAKSHSENYGPSVLCGHVHKYDVHTPRHYNGGLSMSAPCLADLDMKYLDRCVAALAHDNGWVFGVVNNRTGKFEMWAVRRQRHDNVWIDPRMKWI